MKSQLIYPVTLPEIMEFEAISMASFWVSKKKDYAWTLLGMLLKYCNLPS